MNGWQDLPKACGTLSVKWLYFCSHHELPTNLIYFNVLCTARAAISKKRWLSVVLNITNSVIASAFLKTNKSSRRYIHCKRRPSTEYNNFIFTVLFSETMVSQGLNQLYVMDTVPSLHINLFIHCRSIHCFSYISRILNRIKHNLGICILSSNHYSRVLGTVLFLTLPLLPQYVQNLFLLCCIAFVCNAYFLWPLLLTWFNFNPSMDK